MDKISTFKELIDFVGYKYKYKTAVTLDRIYTKKINYFEFKYDIYSLARVMANNEKDDSVIIISENRYEYIVTFLANILLNKRIIIFKNMFDLDKIINVIENKNVKTIYFSNRYKSSIKEIVNNFKDKIDKNELVLISFDSNNKTLIKDYEKILNAGRYIENYSIEDIEKERDSKILIIEKEIENEFNSKDFIKCANVINKNIKFRKRKKIKAKEYINTFYEIILNIIIPIYNVMNIEYKNIKKPKEEYNENYDKSYFNKIKEIIEKNKKIDINIIRENKNYCEVLIENQKFLLNYENNYMNVKKIKNNILNLSSNNITPNFILIKSNKKEKLKNDVII